MMMKIKKKNFRKEQPPENIKKINELLRQLYKKNELPIFTDYYKKVDEKKIYWFNISLYKYE